MHGGALEETSDRKLEPLSAVSSANRVTKPKLQKKVKKRKLEDFERDHSESSHVKSTQTDDDAGKVSSGGDATQAHSEEEEIETLLQNNNEGHENMEIPSTTPLSLPSAGIAPQKFSDLELSDKTMRALEEDMKFTEMTEIQQRGKLSSLKSTCPLSCPTVPAISDF